jgi:tetratricopeptide (TPR) repeat protein
MRKQIFMTLFLTASLATASSNFNQLISLGQQALSNADLDSAAKYYTEACAASPESPLPIDQRASCDHHLAIIDEVRGDLPASEAKLRRALSEWQEAGAAFQASYAMSLMNLGELYRKQHRLAESEENLRHALNIVQTFRAEYPHAYAQALSRLGGLYLDAENSPRAQPLLLEAVNIFKELGTVQDAELARALDGLGVVSLVAGRYPEAQGYLTEAVARAISALGDAHPESAAYQSDLALAYIQQHQYDRAEPLLRRARFITESRAYHDNSRLATILAELSLVACGQNKLALAEQFARESMNVLESISNPNPAVVVLARVNLAVVYLREHRPDEAERLLPAAVETERRIAPDSCLLADGLRELAELRAMQHSWHVAAELYRESIDIYERRLGPWNPSLTPILKAYVDALRHDGRPKTEVKAAEARVKAMIEG